MTDTVPRSAGLPGKAPARVKRLPAQLLLPAGALLGAVAGGAYGTVQTPQYTATSYVMAVPDRQQLVDSRAALGFAQAYGRLVTQPAVLGDAELRAGVPVASLRKSVRSATSPDAPMVSISATSPHAGLAADIANTVTGSLTAYADRAVRDTGVRLVRLSPALKPTRPSSASRSLTTLVGAAAGGLLGGLALLVRPRRTAYDGTAGASVPAPAHADEVQEQLG
ncbi:lipopolysaccharide biosynthesis protein [Streptomyces sp. NPDC046759]|uniref:lipopolysaccharide biosynthesis protein n=1 Tax=Streptomyces sp. NPDC046759 TaxID=3155019 RepID=UPI0033FD6E69